MFRRRDYSNTNLGRSVVPAQIEQGVPRILDEVEQALIMPEIVDETLDRMILHPGPLLIAVALGLAAAIAWLPTAARLALLGAYLLPVLGFLVSSGGRSKYKRPFPVDALLYGLKFWYVYVWYGGQRGIGRHAIRAVLLGSGLSRHQWARKLFGYDDRRKHHRQVFLAMGRDAVPGRLHYEARNNRMQADLDLFHLAPRYTAEEGLMSDLASRLGGELRTSPAWSFLGKPFATHNQGGCSMGTTPDCSVVDENGAVWGCEGLYVLDGSILPRSVGVNPASTIAAIAERGIFQFIRNHAPAHPNAAGLEQYAHHRDQAQRWRAELPSHWSIEPTIDDQPIHTPPLALEFDERMYGFYQPGEHVLSRRRLARDAKHRRLEMRGRPDYPLRVTLTARVPNLLAFFEDPTHELRVQGKLEGRLPHAAEVQTYEVIGTLQLLVERSKLYALPQNDPRRRAQECWGEYRSVRGRPRRERLMTYCLWIQDQGLVLKGYKRIRDDPGLDAWRDTSTLFVTLRDDTGAVRGAGAIHVDLPGFLFGQLASIRVGYVREHGFEESADATHSAWAIAKFGAYFFGSLQRIYTPEAHGALGAAFKAFPNNVRR
jgi:cholesterol oxidase